MGVRMLDFSPSRALYRALKSMPDIEYVSSDFAGEFVADRHYDLTKLDLPDASVDLITCFHILEHIDNDRAAMAELHRVLAPGGSALIQTPFKPGVIDEDSTVTTPEGRRAAFGQEDHVRTYSADGLGPASRSRTRCGRARVLGHPGQPSRSRAPRDHSGRPQGWLTQAQRSRRASDLLDVRSPCVRFHRAVTRRCSQSGGTIRVVQQRLDARRQPLRITRPDEPPCPVVLKDLADLIEIRSDDRLAHRHVLEELGGRTEERRAVRVWHVWRDEDIARREVGRAVSLCCASCGRRRLPGHPRLRGGGGFPPV